MPLTETQATRARLLSEGLLQFIETLREADYAVGAHQFISAQNLVLELAARGSLPADTSRLKSLVRPLVCSTPQQQEEFDKRFDNWLETTAPELVRERRSTSTTRLKVGLRDDKARSERAAWIFGVVALVVVLVIGVLVLDRPAPDDPDRVPPDDTTTGELGTPGVQPPPGRPQPTTDPTPWLLWTIMIGTVGGGAATWYWLRQRFKARQFLTSRLTEMNRPVKELLVQQEAPEIFEPKTLIRAAQNLRLHRPLGAEYVDAEATVKKSAEEVWYTEVTTRRLIVPEYLVLVNRAGYRDHQARYLDGLLQWLIDRGVFMDRYFYDGDPRTCTPAKQGAKPIALQDLEVKHANSRLLIFSSGEEMIDPFTGELAEWTHLLEAWQLRALLTPENPSNWGYREELLTASGMVLFPANERGLHALVEDPEATHSWSGPGDLDVLPIPDLLQHDPQRWLDDYSPDPETLDGLLDDLRWYMGDRGGFRWLAACAVYPELHWSLTLRIGRELQSNGKKLLTEQRLLTLARLPWFRYGRMPAWMRDRLIAEMTTEEQSAVRRVVRSLVATAVNEQQRADPLEIATDDLTTELGRRVLPWLTKEEPSDSPLRERVFATFMADRGALAIPRAVGELLRPAERQPRDLSKSLTRLRRASRALYVVNGVAWPASLLILVAANQDSQAVAMAAWLLGLYFLAIPTTLVGHAIQHHTVTRLGAVGAVSAAAGILGSLLGATAIAQFVASAMALAYLALGIRAWRSWSDEPAPVLEARVWRLAYRAMQLAAGLLVLTTVLAMAWLANVAGNAQFNDELAGAFALAVVTVLAFGTSLIVLGRSAGIRDCTRIGTLHLANPVGVTVTAIVVVNVISDVALAQTWATVVTAVGVVAHTVTTVALSIRWSRRALGTRAPSERQLLDLPSSLTKLRRASRVLVVLNGVVWLASTFLQDPVASYVLLLIYVIGVVAAVTGYAIRLNTASWLGVAGAFAAAVVMLLSIRAGDTPMAVLRAVAFTMTGAYLMLGVRAWREWSDEAVAGLESHAWRIAHRLILTSASFVMLAVISVVVATGVALNAGDIPAGVGTLILLSVLTVPALGTSMVIMGRAVDLRECTRLGIMHTAGLIGLVAVTAIAIVVAGELATLLWGGLLLAVALLVYAVLTAVLSFRWSRRALTESGRVVDQTQEEPVMAEAERPLVLLLRGLAYAVLATLLLALLWWLT